MNHHNEKLLYGDPAQDKRWSECVPHCPLLGCWRRGTSASCPLAPISVYDPTIHEHDHLLGDFLKEGDDE
jgi:hypothetical protein